MQDGRVELTLAQVADLRAAVPALEFAGASVRLPDELRQKEELDLEQAGLSFAPGPLSLGGVVEYDLHAALGGRQISDEEFRALAAATQPLVRIGGEWTLLGDKALRRARQLAQLALHSPGIPALTALGATLAGRAELRGFEMEVDSARSTELERLAARAARPRAARAGRGRRGVPRCAAALPGGRPGLAGAGCAELGLGALLADDMGLGKTVPADRLPAGALRPGRFAGADRVPGIRARQLAPRAGGGSPPTCRCTCTTGPTARITSTTWSATTWC